MQQVFEVLLRKPTDKSICAYLTDCKTSGLENTMEMVYPSGGRGNVYVGRGFGHSRHARMNVETATFNMDVLAMQNGTEVVTGATERTKYMEIDLVSGTDKYELAVPAEKVAGETRYIGRIYAVASDGSYVKEYSEADELSGTAFTFAKGDGRSTKDSITLNTNEATSVMGGSTMAVKLGFAYTVKTADTAQKIHVSGDGIPDIALVSAYGLAADVCTGELFPCEIEGRVQIDGNWNLDLASDGEPAVQNLSMEFIRGCGVKDLYTFLVFTDEEEEAKKAE